MLLTETIDDSFEYGQYKLHVDMSFDNILRFYQLTNDPDFNDIEKVIVGNEILIDDYHKVQNLPFDEQFELYKYILREFLGHDLDERGQGGTAKKDFDFEVDADRIYASFLMDYGIDLNEQQGRLHWTKFMALLNGLSERTPLMQVIKIRNMDVPKPNKHNQKERKRIMDLKRKHALEQSEEVTQQNLDAAFSFLSGKAGD